MTGDGAGDVMIRIWLIPFSTNVERVSLALAHKGLEAEAVPVDPEDRSEVLRVSGQELVPVAEIEGEIVPDSTAILRRLEERYPLPPLWPADLAQCAGFEIFIRWFEAVWKVPPNAIAAELAKPAPDEALIAECAAELTAGLAIFEHVLEGRRYLFSDEFAAADCVAFPFLKYALLAPDPADDDPFHRVLHEYQPLGDGHAALRAWIERVDAHPRALSSARAGRGGP